MSIYVYISEQCQKDAEKQNYRETIEKFARKIENDQHTDSFDRFPPPHLKKRFERQIRLVADEQYVGEHSVVVFLRLFVRGGSEYKEFGDSNYQIVPGKERMAKELDPGMLADFIASRQTPPPPPNPPPDQLENGYLYTALSVTEDIYHDHHCCETQMWVEEIQKPEFSDRLALFVEPVLETIDWEDTGLSEIRCSKDRDFGILFRRLPAKRMVLLFTPFRGQAPRVQVEAKYPALMGKLEELDQQAALQKAKRAYPHEILLSEDAWFRIQKDREGNMALSLEEISVLESVRGTARSGFPLFINGRAGSGKSTILQYLFSEYLFYHLTQDCDAAPPLLFACNDELLARSRNSVRSLLQARHSKTVNTTVKTERFNGSELESHLSASIKNFHSWLRFLAPAEKFPLSNRIDYGGFKAWWESKFSREPAARRLFDADISWHVIRTYIKGTSGEGYLDPEDYLEVPSKEKTVTPETYRLVFERVWKRYADDQQKKGLWDHQDLARHILSNGLLHQDYPVIFCDEAQDFTRIELEILDRHCLFNARTIPPHDAPRVPIAFAGDPFQTLNPTGFRWEATKAYFSEKFIKSFPGTDKLRELNYQELRFNYRSSRNIVLFCNTIQLVRSVVFDIPEILPQQPWFDEESSPNVVYFEKSNADVLRALKAQSEIRIIVPCEEGDEAEWTRQNGLGEFVEFDEQDVPKNVVSASRIKGLEYARVVLFGFGGECPAPLLKCIRSDSEKLTGDTAIEPQYFLNRLYVAASRPKKRLFIVDSKESINAFWNQIFDRQQVYTLHAQDTAAWEKAVGTINQGSLESWDADREDPRETADKHAKEGRLRSDRFLLRQAAQSYDTAGHHNLAKECRAEALELESQHLQAARLWEQLERVEKSVSAAWAAGVSGFPYIVELGALHPLAKPTLEYKFAAFFAGTPGINEGMALVLDLTKALEHDEKRNEILTRDSWANAVGRFIDKFRGIPNIEPGLWKVAYSNLRKVAEAGLRISPEMLGELAYSAEHLTDAFNHWNFVEVAARSSFEGKYLRSKIASLPYPQMLEAFGELMAKQPSVSDAEKLIQKFTQEENSKLKDVHWNIIAKAYLFVGRPFEGMAHLGQTSDVELRLDYIETLSKNDESHETIVSLIGSVTAILAISGNWGAIFELMSQQRLGKRKYDNLTKFAKSNVPVYHSTFVAFIAEDPSFDSVGNDLKTAIARYFSQVFGSAAVVQWRREIHPLKVGEALEKTGLYKEILPYYESVAKAAVLSERIRNIARERWIIVKMLQAAREKDAGNKARSEEQIREAKQRASSLGYASPDEVPKEFPAIPPIEAKAGVGVKSTDLEAKSQGSSEEEQILLSVVGDPSAAEAIDYSLDEKIGSLRFRVNPSGERLIIEHVQTFDQAVVKVSSKVIQFDGENVAGPSAGEATLEKWRLTIDISSLKLGSVLVRWESGMALSIPVRATT